MHRSPAGHTGRVQHAVEPPGLGDHGSDRGGHGVTVQHIGPDVDERLGADRRFGSQVDAHDDRALGHQPLDGRPADPGGRPVTRMPLPRSCAELTVIKMPDATGIGDHPSSSFGDQWTVVAIPASRTIQEWHIANSLPSMGGARAFYL